jgi:hypothetical protein
MHVGGEWGRHEVNSYSFNGLSRTTNQMIPIAMHSVSDLLDTTGEFTVEFDILFVCHPNVYLNYLGTPSKTRIETPSRSDSL